MTVESLSAKLLSGAVNSLWLAPAILLAAETALRLRPDWPAVVRYRWLQAAGLFAATTPWFSALEVSWGAAAAPLTGAPADWVVIPTATATESAWTASPWLALLWLAGIAAGLARIAVGCRGVLRSKAEAEAGPAALNSLFAQRGSELGLRRRFETLFSDEAFAPLAAGWLRPAVLLPRDLPRALASDDVERLWTHEAAHLERWDDWARLFERAVRAVYFFNPAFWWASRRLDFEREAACDRWAAERLGDARGLAGALARLLEARVATHGLAPAAAGRPGDLERRIRMLTQRDQEFSCARRRIGLVLAGALTTGAIAVALLAPRVVLAQSEPPVEAAVPATPQLWQGPTMTAQASPPQPPQPVRPNPRPNPQPAARPNPAPRPNPVVVPPVPPVPPVRPNIDIDVDVREEVQREMRFHQEIQPEVEAMSKLAQEMAEVASSVHVEAMQAHAAEIQAHVQEHVAPIAQQMAQLGIQMSSLAEDSPDWQQLHAQMEQLEARLKEKEGALKQIEQRMEAAAERMKPDEAAMRALEQKMKVHEKRIEEKHKAFEAKEKAAKQKAKNR